jgi:tetratricopeptide (TPR) repeat protein
MKPHRYASIFVTLASIAGIGSATAVEPSFTVDLASIEHEFDVANFEVKDEDARQAAFDSLVRHAAELSQQYPDRVEAVAWEGIVLSTYAGEVGAMSAMKYAKAARAALLRAERMDPESLNGGVYASLGALYSKVPGGFIGFGDDELAAQYFTKALEVDPDNIDSNFFYGEFLLEQGKYTEAVAVLERALGAPMVTSRPVFDAGRRAEIRDLLAEAQRKQS